MIINVVSCHLIDPHELALDAGPLSTDLFSIHIGSSMATSDYNIKLDQY